MDIPRPATRGSLIVMMRNRLVLSCVVAALLFASCKAKGTPPTGEHPGAVQAPPDSSFGEKLPAGAQLIAI